MGSRRFNSGNGRRGELERSIEGKRGRCTKCKGDGNYLRIALVRVTELGGLFKYQFPAKRTLFLASLYGFLVNHDYRSK